MCPQERNDAIAEVVALVWAWYRRLLAKGKDATPFIVTLAQFASRHVKAGSPLCGNENSKDVMSRSARRQRGFQVERLKTPWLRWAIRSVSA